MTPRAERDAAHAQIEELRAERDAAHARIKELGDLIHKRGNDIAVLRRENKQLKKDLQRYILQASGGGN